MRARTIAAAVLLVAAFVSRAGAQTVVAGVVSAVEESSVVIDGQAYAVTATTQFKTSQGGSFAPSEIQAGTKVEAEVGDAGQVVVLKADLLR